VAGVQAGNAAGFDWCMKVVRDARHAAGDDATPLYITEMGLVSGPTWNELQQARTCLLIEGILQRQSDVRMCLFNWLTSTPGNVFGWEFLEYATLRRKPVWDAIRTTLIAGGTWRPFTLQNSWVNAWASGTTFPAFPGYRADPATRRVDVRGAVKTGSSATAVIATLPVGARPSAPVVIPATNFTTSTVTAAVQVNPDGTIVPTANTVTTALVFEGSFVAEQ
jgi:hypothetical protein